MRCRIPRSRPPVGAALALALALAAAPGSAVETPVPGEELELSSSLRVRVRQGRTVELHVLPGPADTYATIAERVAGSPTLGPLLSDWNGSVPPSPQRFVRVPLSLLTDEYRALVLLNLFPRDRRDGVDWIHVARSGVLPTYDEGLWQVAEWFTGDGTHFRKLQEVNRLDGPEIAAGREIRIPAELLHPAFATRSRSTDGSLEYGEDEDGPFAGYRLKAGEALYSAVVVRYTGRTGSEDVMNVAGVIAERSDIRDLTDIPVRHLVKIPFDYLEPEHLPSGHPRRVEAEAAREELAAALARNPVSGARAGLGGVVVILDPGHGGRDLGTMNNGIWEHDYVYDVACRLKEALERRTEARVFLTLEDGETGCVPSRDDKLRANRQGTVLTTPPFLARNDGEAAIAVNLRWYLANSIYRNALGGGTSADRVVFLSLHADARHGSLRGIMVYVPGARFRQGSYGHTSSTYRKYQEVREKPRVKFSYNSRVRSEAVSRKLADEIVAAFRDAGLPVQPYKPVRDRIIRGRREWLPAVLRGNEVPAKVLVEMVNLTNSEDAALLASASRRQQLAEALLRSLFGYFGESPPPTDDTRGAAAATRAH